MGLKTITSVALGTPAALWAVWYALVLRAKQRTTADAAPRWLRVAVSGAWFRFCSSWVNFSHNTDDMIKQGRIDPTRPAMLCLGPHGQYTIGALGFYSHWVAKGYPWEKMNA